uniref:SMODS and SLOG-associating 2TM effector domain-containing protein n=1 Tax=viral metagenome TaxID=1070528 RepID=A0A6C0C6C8_9ZZZZ
MNNSHFHELRKKEDEEKKRKAAEIEKSKWTGEQESLLAEWAEKAACYRWLHSRAEKYYRFRNYLFTIPVIVLSTLTGTANFAMDSFVPDDSKKVAMGIVGGVNIFAGILSTLQNFLRYAELMESHRAISVSWSKFARNITVELALDEKRRKSANDFLKVCRAEFDRLIEQAPLIEDDILKLFKTRFKDVDIIKPEICNGLHKCKIYKPSQEEKVANIVANAGDRFHDLKTKSLKRLQIKQTNNLLNHSNNVNKNHENVILINSDKHNFTNINKVSDPVKESKPVNNYDPLKDHSPIKKHVKEPEVEQEVEPEVVEENNTDTLSDDENTITSEDKKNINLLIEDIEIDNNEDDGDEEEEDDDEEEGVNDGNDDEVVINIDNKD